MFRADKSGNVTLAGPAWATLVVAVFLFGGWMTKMTIDVGQIYDISTRVKSIEQSLGKAGIASQEEPSWPKPNPSSPQSSASLPSSSRGVGTKRESQ